MRHGSVCVIVVHIIIHLYTIVSDGFHALIYYYTGIKIKYTFGHETAVGVLNDALTLNEMELKIKRPALFGCFFATRLINDLQSNNNTYCIEIKCV